MAALKPFGPGPTTTASSMLSPENSRDQSAGESRSPRRMTEYWYSRWLFERALAGIYLFAFIAAAVQFVPLLGEHGLAPVGRWLQLVPFRSSPSLFYFFPKDAAFRAGAWLGVALSLLALSSLPQRMGAVPSAVVWAAL